MNKSIRLTASQLLVNGRRVTKGLPMIGKGLFSYVYYIKEGQQDRALIATCDTLKECYSLGWMPEKDDSLPCFFPQDVRKIDTCDDGNYCLYSMPLYTCMSSLKECLLPEAYAVYQALRKLQTRLFGLAVWDAVKEIQKDTNLPEPVKEMLIDGLEAMGNYGTDIGIEVSPRNVAVSEGKLVLLDIFYIRSMALKVRHGSRKGY